MLEIKEELIDCPDSCLDLWLAVMHQYADDVFIELQALETGYFSGSFLKAVGYATSTPTFLFGPADKKEGQRSFWKIDRMYNHPRYHSDWQFQITALDDLNRKGPQISYISHKVGADPDIVAPKLLEIIRGIVKSGKSFPWRNAFLLKDSASERVQGFEWYPDTY